MPKKVLICEDTQYVAIAFKRNIKGGGRECSILFDANSDIVLSKLEETLKNENPDYVLIDGLNGLWKNVAEKTNQYGAVPIICSANEDVLEAAKEKGYIAFDKIKESEELFKYIREI